MNLNATVKKKNCVLLNWNGVSKSVLKITKVIH